MSLVYLGWKKEKTGRKQKIWLKEGEKFVFDFYSVFGECKSHSFNLNDKLAVNICST